MTQLEKALAVNHFTSLYTVKAIEDKAIAEQAKGALDMLLFIGAIKEDRCKILKAILDQMTKRKETKSMNKEIIKAVEKTESEKEVLAILNHIHERAGYVTEKYSPSSYSEETKKEAFNYIFMSEVLAKITDVQLLHDNTTLAILLAASMLKT